MTLLRSPGLTLFSHSRRRGWRHNLGSVQAGHRIPLPALCALRMLSSPHVGAGGKPPEQGGLWRMPGAQSLLPATPVTSKAGQAPAAERSSSARLWFLKDKPKPNNVKSASKRLWLFLLHAAASPHEAELGPGLGLQPAQLRGTCSVWAPQRVRGGWRISSSH